MALQDGNELAALRQQLESRAAELRGEVAALRDEEASDMTRTPGGPVEDDAERGEEESRHTVRRAEQGRDTQELDAIGAALDRMDAGSYGECVDCGCDIPLDRLRAQPSAARCTACQERAERQ